MENFEEHLNSASEIVKTWPEWKQNILGGDSAQAKYVLVYGKDKFFKNNNIYLQTIEYTENIDEATKMTLSEAKTLWDSIPKKENINWHIYSIKMGYHLDKEYRYHIIQEEIKLLQEKIELLKKEL